MLFPFSVFQIRSEVRRNSSAEILDFHFNSLDGYIIRDWFTVISIVFYAVIPTVNLIP